MTSLTLDYETFSECNIKTEGGGKYVRHPSTEILMLSWGIDDGPINLWEPHKSRMPAELKDALTDPHVYNWAFNAAFERGITDFVLPRYEPGVVVPRDTWRCTMFYAYGMSFKGGLNEVLKQVGFDEQYWKNPEGQRLINKFSKIQPPSRKVSRWNWENAPEDWNLFCEYCVQDSVVERALRNWLQQFDPISDDEWMTWQMDQDINDRGMPVDRVLVSTAIAMVEHRKRELLDEMKQITGLENPASNQQLQPWLVAQGVPVPNMQAPTLDAIIPTIQDPVLKRVVQCKRYVAQTATAKWGSVDLMSCDDSTLKGMFVAGGASRTRRWASRGINLQNMKRPMLDDMDGLCADIKRLNLAPYQEHETMDLLASSVRGAIAAPDGYKLVVADLGSIESRVLGWMSGCARINGAFARGADTYKEFAAELYSVPYDQVTKEQRTFCKPPTLGCGYQLGPPGLVAYSESMGVVMTLDEARHAVNTFRSWAFEVNQMWKWLVEAVTEVTNRWTEKAGYRVHIHRDQYFLYITLPSGRRLTYYQPIIRDETIYWVDDSGVRQSMVKPSFTYMGFNQFTKKWERISTHGGGLTENIDQAISRDILAYHMRLASNRGHVIVGHIHDEIITVAPNEWADARLDHLKGLMGLSPPWAPDLLLDAEGYVGQHLRKD